MKSILFAIAATAMIAGASVAAAQDSTTVIHKQNEDGDRSKTVVKKDNGSKTVIKRHGANVKKVHVSPEGDKTVVKKTTEQ